MSEEENPHDEPRANRDPQDTFREMVGGVLATGLWFFLDLYFLYPENHKAAWWLGLLFICFQLIQNSFMRLRPSVIAIGIVLLIGGIGSFFLPPMLPQETDTHGGLIPANDLVPPNGCDFAPAMPKGASLLLLGRNGAWTLDQSGFVALHAGNCTNLTIERTPGGVLISGDIFAKDGNVVAHLNNNQFTLVSREISYSERSPDLSTLRVYDPEGKEAFYVRYINPQTIDIRGAFYCPDGSALIVKADRTVTSYPSGCVFDGNCVEGRSVRIDTRTCGMGGS